MTDFISVKTGAGALGRALFSRNGRAETAGRNGIVLVVADFPPLFDQHSGGLRLKTLIQMIGDLGWSIVFASSWERERLPGSLGVLDERARYEKVLRQAGVVSFHYGLKELNAALIVHGRSIRHAFVTFPHVAEQTIPIIRLHCPVAQIIYDMVDFHAIRLEREARLKEDAALLIEADAMRRVEVMNARAADITIAISSDEKVELLNLAPTTVVDVFPNVFEQPTLTPPGPDGRSDLLFVGGFWHRPNEDAVKWFVAEIWPHVRSRKPCCRFRIVGSNAGDEVRSLASVEGVDVVGYVPDLTHLFNHARVFVAPLRYGAGVKGKVGQSLANGLPVVTTRIGAEGMSLVADEHVLIADAPETFADAIVRLMDDDDLWSALQNSGLSLVSERFSVAVLREKVGELFNG